MIDDDTIRLEVPANFKYLEVIGACITAFLQQEKQIPMKEKVTSGVELAVHETCANIIEHAYAGIFGRIYIAMQVANNPRRLEIKIRDHGAPFFLGNIPQPDVEEDVQIRGYGLFLVHQLMDDVRYIPQSKDNVWQLVKNL